MGKFIRRTGWLVILVGALWVSGWSLYTIARHFGVPWPVAIFASASFDGVAWLAADNALSELKDNAPDTWPRTAVWLFALGSAWVNSWHAILWHEPEVARTFWVVPPLAAVVAYDLHLRKERRKAQARIGKIYPRPLPSWGSLTWLLFPYSTLTALRGLVAGRRTALAGVAARLTLAPVQGMRPAIPRESRPAISESEVVSEKYVSDQSEEYVSDQSEESDSNVYGFPEGTRYAPMANVRSWAVAHGWPELAGKRGGIPLTAKQAYQEAMNKKEEA
jgi:Protein of unknown function (DUF2637)